MVSIMIKKLIDFVKEYDSKDDREPRSKKLFGLAALYNTPNEIITAAADVAGKGYEKFDVYTPYPMHGMDDAMGMKSSKVTLSAVNLSSRFRLRFRLHLRELCF